MTDPEFFMQPAAVGQFVVPGVLQLPCTALVSPGEVEEASKNCFIASAIL